MTRKNVSLLTLLSVPAMLMAQDTTKIATLREVTVTASRSEQPVLTTPRSVTVITASDIQKQPYQNLADLLQRYEGIFVPGTFQTPGSLQSLFLRGADNKHTLMMIDGIRLSDVSTTDNLLDLTEVSLNSIEKIEIVRGSQGTLYGGSAVGGVINIITKKNAQPGTSGMIKANAGTFGKGTFLSNTQASVTYTAKSGFYGRAEILNTNSNGFNSAVQPATGFFIGETDDFRKTDYAAKVGFINDKWDAYVGYRRIDQKADIDEGAFKDDETYTLDYSRNLFTYGLSRKFSDNISLKFFGGYTNTDRKSFDDSSITSLSPLTYDRSIFEATYTGKNLVNELQLNYTKGKANFVAGTGYTHDMMNTNTNFVSYAFNFSSKTNYDTVGAKMGTAFVYAHGKYAIPFSKADYGVNLAAGLRYSNNDRFGDFLSAEFTPNLQLGKNVFVFAALATGYNAPSLYQLFAPEKDFTSNISRGFAGLEPEESRSIELGVKAVVAEKVGLRLSMYNNQVKNYIDYVYLWNGDKAIPALTFNDYRGDTYLNTGKQTNKGIEAGVDINFSGQWQLHSNISYNDGRLKYDPSFIDRSKILGHQVQVYGNGAFLNAVSETTNLVRRPNTISNTSLVFKPTNKWQFTADARTIGKRSDVFYDFNLGPFGALGRNSTAAFELYNLSAFWKMNKMLSVSASCFNITNKKFTELNGFQTRGRSVFATIQFDF